jgi:superfamily I DNA/RNA helicase
VALTRAKEQLVWAYSAGNPSPFIDELKRGAA